MKILIVDDIDSITSLFKLTIETFLPDSIIKTAENGLEVIEFIKTKQFVPDLILMDYMMPNQDGMEISKWVKQFSNENDIFIYIIMITGKVQKKTEIEALEIVDDYIPKPVELDELINRIRVGKRMVNLFQDKERLIQDKQNIYHKLLNINVRNEKIINVLSTTIEQLAIGLSEAIEYKDQITKAHTLKVGYLAEAIAKKANLDIKTVEATKYAGFFHDVGKIGIPDNILLKPDKLTQKEFLKIKSHPAMGVDIIKSISIFDGVHQGILHHHERWDGKGYPHGLKENDIPIVAAIISVADCFDVINSPRPYKKRKSMKEAFDEIVKNRGIQFSPFVVDYFKEIYTSGEIKKIYQEVDKKALIKT